MKILQLRFLVRRQLAKTSCSMFLSFLKKCFFNLCLKLLIEFVNFRSSGKLFQTIVVGYGKFFWSEHVFLKGCFNFKTEVLEFTWFHQRTSFLKKIKALEWRCWLNLSEKGRQLIFSKFYIPIWILLYSWGQYLIPLFWTVCNSLLNFLFRFEYQADQA